MRLLIIIVILNMLKYPFISYSQETQGVEYFITKLDLGTIEKVLELEDFSERDNSEEIIRINISKALICETVFSGFVELSCGAVNYLSLSPVDTKLDYTTAEDIFNCLSDAVKQRYGEGIYVNKLPYFEDSHKTKQSAFIWQIDDRILILQMSSYDYSGYAQIALLNITIIPS